MGNYTHVPIQQFKMKEGRLAKAAIKIEVNPIFLK